MLVYMLHNQINGKVYVGQTRQPSLTRRWSRSLNNCRNSHLAAAVAKYGAHSFKRTVLAHASCQQELDLLEQFFILIFHATNGRFGYNHQAGGFVGGKHSPETIRRISESNKRHWVDRTPEQMILYSENARLRWDMWPEERKRQWREASISRWNSRSQEERERIRENVRRSRQGPKPYIRPWNKGLLGWNAGFHHTPEAKEKVRAANKGRRWGPQTPEHKQKISEALKMYYAKKRIVGKKKPPVGTKNGAQYQRREETLAFSKQPGVTAHSASRSNVIPFPVKSVTLKRNPQSGQRQQSTGDQSCQPQRIKSR